MNSPATCCRESNPQGKTGTQNKNRHACCFISAFIILLPVMKSFVNIKQFKDDIASVDIFNAKIISITKDAKVTAKNNSQIDICALELRAGEETYKANLWGKWRGLSHYLTEGDNVNVIRAKSRDFDETKTVNVLDSNAMSYIILEPSILIDATKMASVAIRNDHYCFFKYHQNRMKIQKVINYYVIKGIVVGNVFDDFLMDIDGFDFNASFEKHIGKEKIKFIKTDYVPKLKNIKDDIRKDMGALTNWRLNSNFKDCAKFIEPYYISPKYGLLGRMDILFKSSDGTASSIIELKTGRSPDGKNEAWINHKFQVIAYNFIFDSVYGDAAGNDAPARNIVLYSGSKDVQRSLRIPAALKRDFIFLRNKMVFYEKRYTDFDYETMLSFRRDLTRCNKCPSYLKDKCKNIYRIFDDLTDEQRSYYFSFYKMAERERAVAAGRNARLWDSENEVKYKMTDLTVTDYNSDEGVVTLQFGDNPSEIRGGDPIALYCGSPQKEPLLRGEVISLQKNSVNVRLWNAFANELDKNVKWTLSIFNSTMVADTMLDGLYNFAKSPGRFKDLILLNRRPEFDNINLVYDKTDSDLNPAQRSAVIKSVCSKDYYLLQGPPGTGKTKTIAAIITELVKRKQRVILSALTNRAVDNVLLRLIQDHGFDDFLRVGGVARVDPRLHNHLLSVKAANYTVEQIRGLKKEIAAAGVIAATTASVSVSFIFDGINFDAAVIDEASQIPEPIVLAALTKAGKFIMVGDLHQLGPVIRSDCAMPDEEKSVIPGVTGLDKTLFQRLWEFNSTRDDIEDDNNPCGSLDTQYRMNEEIIRFPSGKFYGGILKTHESVATGKITVNQSNELYDILDPDAPVVFIDVQGSSELRENKAEAELVAKIVSGLVSENITGSGIGVISPFKAQCALIRRMIEPFNKDNGILVDTVERFQGSERDIIITSFVVGDAGGLKFLEENDALNRKLNVTITRACKKLILVGNRRILTKDAVYAELISFIDKSPASKVITIK